MCHIILALPVLGLPLFWLLPLPLAVEANAAVLLVSAWMYWLVYRAMARPVVTGVEALSREAGRVVAAAGRKATARIHGELWQCRGREALHEGDTVRVVGRDGLTLRVERVARDTPGARHGVS